MKSIYVLFKILGNFKHFSGELKEIQIFNFQTLLQKKPTGILFLNSGVFVFTTVELCMNLGCMILLF